MKPIAAIAPPLPPASPFRHTPSLQGQEPTDKNLFAGMVQQQLADVNEMQVTANGMVHSMLTGGDVSEAEALTAVQKADLAFRMLLQVRNKLIEAYREVQQIQI